MITSRQLFFPLFLSFAFLFAACGTDTTSGRKADTLPPAHRDSADTAHTAVTKKRLVAPVIDGNGKQCSLQLNADVLAALKQYDAAFESWQRNDFVKTCDGSANYYTCSPKQLPFAVIGLFNEDSVPDIILHGHNRANDLLVAVLSGDSAYSVTTIERAELKQPSATWIDNAQNKGLWMLLRYYDPAEWPAQKKPAAAHDVFLYGTCGKGYAAYFLENGKFSAHRFTD